MSIVIEKGGLLTTVQDLGRYGYQQYGMPVAGAMDGLSYRIGQRLVGNSSCLGALECTVLGPSFTVKADTTVAFTGADMSPQVNGQAVAMYEAIALKAGDEVTTSYASCGMRMYISFAGGFDLPYINGSQSTHLKSKIGGLEGRALRDGDEIALGEACGNVATADTSSSCKAVGGDERSASGAAFGDKGHDASAVSDELKVSHWDFDEPIRFIWGPQDEAFTKESKMAFVNGQYSISLDSDRMGYRLEGEALVHETSADIISDAIVFGAIQVPANGQPIVLMADRQTTGGYTKIGTVISYDLPRLAQLPLGASLRFLPIDCSFAQKVLRYQEELLSKI